MIANIAIPILLAILLCSFYVDRQHLRRRALWLRVLAWLLPLAIMAYTVQLAREPDYFPDDITTIVNYLTVLAVFVVPLFLVSLCGSIMLCFKKRKVGEKVGWGLSVVILLVYIYGAFYGVRQFEVKHVELSFDDLPAEFDGYKIVQFSDAHLGSFAGFRSEVLRLAVDSINAQQADMVVFTGDLQNKCPQEIEPYVGLLSTIQSRDGIFSVLGNHDYCEYIGSKDPFVIGGNMGLTRSLQEDMGWTLLNNAHRRIRRDSVSIVIAGMENDGEGRFPQLGNVNAALSSVSRDEFVIMLEHDPTSWRRKILPHCHAQLTLSGHTHGGQVSLFGWSPAQLSYKEVGGLYRNGSRMLYVSTGVGGAIPFRIGIPNEIVVITLRSNKKL